MMFPKRKTWRSKRHLAHVRTLACAGCGRPGPSVPHHVVNGGQGLKCSDALTSPLCEPCHGLWHSSENRVGPCSTREESMFRIWCGCVAALGGSRLADNVDPEAVARRLAQEKMLEGQSAVRFWEDGRDVPGPTFAWRSASAWSPKGTREPWLKFRDSRGIDVVFLDCTPGREMPR